VFCFLYFLEHKHPAPGPIRRRSGRGWGMVKKSSAGVMCFGRENFKKDDKISPIGIDKS
jgi:hypothetical protein